MVKDKDSNKEDQIIRQLFRNDFVPDDVPSNDFNRRVMDQVMSEWISKSVYYEPLIDKRSRWWIIPVVLFVFLIGFLFDVGQMATSTNGNMWAENFEGVFQSLYSWIEPIHLLVFGATIAAGILLILDHFLQKLSNI